MTGDLIAAYLAQLRAGLRTPPERTEQILAEAEDHLRESAVAGEAMGLTERDAQEAAIAAFGGVWAVARAHRRPVVAAALAELGMAAMKLGGVYLLTVSVTGCSGVLLAKLVVRIPVSPGTKIVLAQADYARTTGVLTVLAAIGLALLAGYRHARRRRAGRTPAPSGALLGGYFPLAAVICMLTVVPLVIPLLRTINLPGEALASAPGMPAAATFGGAAVAIGYAARMAWILLGQSKSGEAAGERISHAG